jgi:hypothetical protein
MRESFTPSVDRRYTMLAMQRITTFRESVIDMPWCQSGHLFSAILTSDGWSTQKAHLIGWTRHQFIVAVRQVEAATDSLRFRLVANAPDLAHPLGGQVELWPSTGDRSAVRVELSANLGEELTGGYVTMREAMSSLADELVRTVADLALPFSSDVATAGS